LRGKVENKEKIHKNFHVTLISSPKKFQLCTSIYVFPVLDLPFFEFTRQIN